MELITTYAAKDSSGNPVVNDNGAVKIIQDKLKEAGVAMNELNNTEVDKPNIKFTLEELEELKLSIGDMYLLDEFIEE